MIKNNILVSSIVIGLFASIAFILIQPFFGMLTLTSRHAAAYVEIGNYNASGAMALSWALHIGVSIIYTLVSLSIYHVNRSILVNFLQVIILGWATTLIATPANEWVVKFITTGQLSSLSSLSDLNTQVGPKLWLHILFFVLVISGAWVNRYMNLRKSKTSHS